MHKILLIHPDRKLHGIYKRAIPSLTIDSAFDGLSGLRQIKTRGHSLILSDYHLPKLSGASLLKFVRRDPFLYSTPFIFLSGSELMDDSLNLGATDWLVISKINSEILAETCFYHLKSKAYAG